MIAGEGPLANVIKTRVTKSDLNDRIKLLGEIPHESVLERLGEADVLVHPSERDVAPRVVDESLEVGTPVVATSVGKIPDMVDDGKNGFLIERSANAIRDRLEYLYQSPDERQRMAVEGRSDDHQHEWETVIHRIATVYQEATRNG